MKILRAHQAMEACAVALETWSYDDMARPDALAIYSAAAQIQAAAEHAQAAGIQPYDRLPVPEFVAQFAPTHKGQDHD